MDECKHLSEGVNSYGLAGEGGLKQSKRGTETEGEEQTGEKKERKLNQISGERKGEKGKVHKVLVNQEKERGKKRKRGV